MRFLLAFAALTWMGMSASASYADADYVGSEVCADCHEGEASAWMGSHHQLAWTEPSPQTVLGDFNNTEFKHDGTTTRFSRDGDGYSIEVTEKDGVTTTYALHSVVGIAPLQQYLIETEPGRQQSFDVTWDAEENRWYHLYPDQDLPPRDGLHWTGPYKTWNSRCAECHATGYQRNFGERTRKYASTQAEIGVGCEACHGPGSAHVDWAKTGKAPDGDLGETGFSPRLAAGQRDGWVEQCAGCHSRREALGNGNPLPGTAFDDAYTLALLRPGLYHADGQILDEVYVYGSFLQSKMNAEGVACSNCHDPHTAGLKADGNAVCTQCHSPAGNSDFPTLRKAVYDSPEHHRHEAGTEATQCVSCHMPDQVYMGIDARRDHSFRVPRPDLAKATGAPDACTTCHEDQSPDWAAATIAEWEPDSIHRGQHYGQTFAVARTRPSAVRDDLLSIAQDTGQPGIVRATALSYLQPLADPSIADAAAPMLGDPDPVVRANAAILQRGAAPDLRADRLSPTLSDPMLSVRIAAAKQLFDISPNSLTRSQVALLREAMSDWTTSLSYRLDYPETHMVLGGMALTVRNVRAAQAAFREAVQLDPQLGQAWTMLVRLTEVGEGPDAARQVLREALTRVPADPGLQELRRRLGD